MCVNPSNASLKKDKVAPCRGGKPYMGVCEGYGKLGTRLGRLWTIQALNIQPTKD